MAAVGVYTTFRAFREEPERQKVYINAIQNKTSCHERAEDVVCMN